MDDEKCREMPGRLVDLHSNMYCSLERYSRDEYKSVCVCVHLLGVHLLYLASHAGARNNAHCRTINQISVFHDSIGYIGASSTLSSIS